MTRSIDATRRNLLGAAAALPWAGGCAPSTPGAEPTLEGGWVGAAHERGHVLRDPVRALRSAHGAPRRAEVLVVGAGVSGLAAARALLRAGVDDVHVFDLEDTAGGNSRSQTLGGMACPLGAHYLPLPGAQAEEVRDLLVEFGAARVEHGRVRYDERMLCHSPQERLFIGRQWVEGLLPPLDLLPAAQREAAQRDYARFQTAVRTFARDHAFSVPTARARPSAAATALDRATFAQWLGAEGYRSEGLLWYLDYCCRDDYGAGAAFVSAWAGIHYFASRHGFRAPGANDAQADEHEAVLTWPQGNAWLAQRLAAPLGERMHTGQMVLRVRESRFDASIDSWNAATQEIEVWRAPQVVLAVPLFVAARLSEAPLPGLKEAAATLHYAPWLVANLHLTQPLLDRGGAAPAWDNVLMDSATLGYVDAMHQSTRPHPGPTVLTAYWALGGGSAQALREQRTRLLEQPWSTWAGAVLGELTRAHPEVASLVERVDLARYGHAMAIPAPGVRQSAALRALVAVRGRVRLAHGDLAGYSVFEEAFYHGHRVGTEIARSRVSTAPRRSRVAR